MGRDRNLPQAEYEEERVAFESKIAKRFNVACEY